MPSETHGALRRIIISFIHEATARELPYEDRPVLSFQGSADAYAIVSRLDFARLRRIEYNSKPLRYIPVAEVRTDHYTLRAEGPLVEELDQSHRKDKQ